MLMTSLVEATRCEDWAELKVISKPMMIILLNRIPDIDIIAIST